MWKFSKVGESGYVAEEEGSEYRILSDGKMRTLVLLEETGALGWRFGQELNEECEFLGRVEDLSFEEGSGDAAERVDEGLHAIEAKGKNQASPVSWDGKDNA